MVLSAPRREHGAAPANLKAAILGPHFLSTTDICCCVISSFTTFTALFGVEHLVKIFRNLLSRIILRFVENNNSLMVKMRMEAESKQLRAEQKEARFSHFCLMIRHLKVSVIVVAISFAFLAIIANLQLYHR